MKYLNCFINIKNIGQFLNEILLKKKKIKSESVPVTEQRKLFQAVHRDTYRLGSYGKRMPKIHFYRKHCYYRRRQPEKYTVRNSAP